MMAKKTIIDRYMSNYRKLVGVIAVILLVVVFIAGSITCYCMIQDICPWAGFAYYAASVAGGILGGAIAFLVLDLIFALTIPTIMVIFDTKDQITRIANTLDSSKPNQAINSNIAPVNPSVPKPQGNWVQHPVAPAPVPEPPKPQTGYWVCRYCKNKNEWYWEKCHACGKKR